MGLFSDEIVNVVTAYVASTELITEDEYVNTRQQFILSALRHDNEDIAENILASNLAGFPARVQRFIDYGTKYYSFPPPSGNFAVVENTQVLLNRLQWYYNSDTLYIEDAQVGPFDSLFFAYSWCFAVVQDTSGNGWDPRPTTFRIEAMNGSTYTVLNQPFVRTKTNNNGILYFQLYFPPQTGSYNPDPILYTEGTNTYFLNEERTEIAGSYYMVICGFSDDEDRREYWMYRADTYVYPELPATTISNDLYVPVAVLLRDKVWFDDMGEETMETTERLLSKLNMDPHDIKEELLKQEDEEDVEKYDAFIHFQLPVELDSTYRYVTEGSLDSAELEYVYNFLDNQYSPYTNDYDDWVEWALEAGRLETERAETVGSSVPLDRTSSAPSKGIDIKVAGDNGFNMTTGWYFIQKRVRYSYWGEPDFEFDCQDYLDQIPSGDFQWYPEVPDAAIIIKQTSAYRYEAYAIFGLENFYKVNTSDGMRAVEAEGIFLPIHEAMLDTLNAPQRERVLQASLRCTMFLVKDEEQKIKWYQKGLFQVLFVVLTVILVVFTMQVWIASLALALTGVVATVAIFLLKFAIGFLISFVSSFVLGGREGELFALIMGFVMAGGAAGLANNLSATFQGLTNFTFNNALTYLKAAVTGFFKYQSYQIQAAYEELEQEMTDWVLTEKERQEEFEDIYYGLVTNEHLSPLDIVTKGNDYIYAESPDRFYTRSLSQNPGVKSLDLIHQFHTTCLTLPEELGQPNPATSLNDLGGR